MRRSTEVKIKKYRFDEIKNILECEYPIDTDVTDTKMSALGLTCTLQDRDDDHDKNGQTSKEKNQQLLEIIMSQNPNVNYQDKF